MNNDLTAKIVKFLYVLYGLGTALALIFFYLGTVEWISIIDQLFGAFLVLAVHKKFSRTAAVVAVFTCMMAITDYGAVSFGYEAVINEPYYDPGLAPALLIQAIIAIPLFILLAVGCFKYHQLNESKTNWGNVLGIISAIVAYILAAIVIVVGVEITLQMSDDRLDAAGTALVFLIIVTGSWRILPGTRSYHTIGSVASQISESETPSNKSMTTLSGMATGAFVACVMSMLNGAIYVAVAASVVMIWSIALYDHKRLQVSK